MFFKFLKDKANYDLELDQSIVFISQTQQDESTSSITGRFSFSLPAPTVIKSIKVRLRGVLEIPHDALMNSSNGEHFTTTQYQTLASSKTLNSFQLPVGNYEFPFRIPLATKTAETITGPGHDYHTYKVDAIIGRPFWQDTIVSRPVRIYNVPDSATDLAPLRLSSSIEQQSNQGIEYCLSMPSCNIPFGSTFSLDFCFAAPGKDAKLTTITTMVIEKHLIKVAATAAQAALQGIYNITVTKSHSIYEDTIEVDSTSCLETECRACQTVRLPQSLKACSQSIASRAINITHMLVVEAVFRNCDGQVIDKMMETIPFNIYMTPEVLGQDGSIRGKVIHDETDPPPPYGVHICDPLFSFECGTGRQSLCLDVRESAPCYDSICV
ncbi:hypothetical protein BDV25DRAFT_137549 [Aspergillus avenaceus]|uniref:Arrestin C-terminal-like domain-containing protein n=1 Tax=Aspergillus avenaceus TaxID=36643 RepID=A0A5N6U3B8_ASPAV|nr:hypothetical protein BDV25DRAFT_137549 [Aspergillus avenaceus]